MKLFGRKERKLNVVSLKSGDVIRTKNGDKYIILEINGNECYCYSLKTTGEIVQCVKKDDVQQYLGSVKTQIDAAVAWCRANY